MFGLVYRLALILCLISRFSQQLETPKPIRKLEPFSCKRRAKEIENLKIKAFFEAEDDFIMLLDDSLILFQGPFCFENYENEESCIIRAPMTQKIDHGFEYANLTLRGFKSKSKPINRYRTKRETYIVYGDSRHYIVNSIYFTRGSEANPGDGRIKEENTKNITNPDKEDEYKVFKDETYVLLTDHRSYIRFEHQYHNTTGLRIYLNPKRRGAFFRTPFNMSNLMVFFEYQSFDQNYENNTLVVISDSKMHISYLKFLVARDTPNLADNQIELKSYSIKLTDFFNCHLPFESNDAVKGLFQHNGTFYVFINRFYLVIKDDLVETSFKLKDEYYESGNDLVFEHDIMGSIMFETRRSKWVLNLLNEHYLVLDEQLFKVTVETGVLKLVQNDNNPISQNCNWQTLKIVSNEYCFTPKYYYPVLKKELHVSYTQLFENSSVQFDGDLQFIFNYRNRAFVMMTMNSFYVVPYNLTEEGDAIPIGLNSNVSILRQKNHLFDTLDTEPLKKEEGFKTVYLVPAFAAVILIVISLALFYKRERMGSSILSKSGSQSATNDKKRNAEIRLPKRDSSELKK